MSHRIIRTAVAVTLPAALLLTVFAVHKPVRAAAAADIPGKIPLKSAGVLAFGPDGVLFVADSPGGAILAFAGTDGNLYWTTYSEASGWAAVLPLSSTGQTATDTTPAVTHGINGDIAEMVYLSGGHPVFSSLTASGWSSPRLVNTSMGLTGVAIASAP